MEKYVSVNHENIQNINNNNINKVKCKIFTAIKQTLPITKVVVFVVATILLVMLSKEYELVDIFERRWNNQVELYLTWGVLAMVKFGVY